MSYVIFFNVDSLKNKESLQTTLFNGNSFIHIIYYTSNSIYWDKDFHYSGAKTIKKLVNSVINEITNR